MELIRCDAEHIPAVISLYHNTLAYLEQTVNYPKWNTEHPGDSGVVDAVGRGEQFICLDNGAAAGTAVLSTDPEGYYEAARWSVDLARGEYMVIHALAVDPDHMNRGVGGFMVDRCIALARDMGFKAIRLDVVPGNIPAERLYEKKGFSYVGTADLQRNIDCIPVFDLFELNL